MPDLITCSHCGRRLHLPDGSLGKKVRCPACGAVFRAEAGPPVAAETAVHPGGEPLGTEQFGLHGESSIAAGPLPPAEPACPPLTAPRAEQEPVVLAEAGPGRGSRQRRHPRPGFLFLLALLPLGIPALTFLGVFVANMSVVLAAVLGIGLGLCLAGLGIGLALVNWPVVLRALLSVGLSGAGYLAAGAVLVFFLVLNASSFDASAWTECKPAGGGFRVLMPGAPLPKLQVVSGPSGPVVVQTLVFELRQKDFLCSVAYFDQPMESALAISTEQRFQASRDEVIKRLPGAQLHAERELVLDMRPGREFEIEVPGQGYYLQRMYAVPEAGMRRFFLLVVAGGRIRPGCADARKFFDSFAVDTRAAEPLPSPVRPWQPLNRIQRVRRR